MPIRTCLFDMGNVLVYFSHERMSENIASLCETDVETVNSILFGSELQVQIECGKITEEEFHRGFEERLNRSIDFEALKVAAADIFWLNEPMPQLLADLKQAGIRLVLLSNTSITHFDFIKERFRVLDAFDDFTTSYGAGAMKPDAAIYEDALSKANCSPEECFYTDDIAKYIDAARQFGIQAEVFASADETRSALRKLGVNV